MPSHESSATPFSAIQPRALESLASALIIDVRSQREFAEAHIPGAILLPLETLNADDVSNVANRLHAENCVLVCKSGVRSALALQKLRSSGNAGISLPPLGSLEGGINAWKAEGLPLTGAGRQSRAISLERQVRIGAGSLVLVGVILALLVHPWFLGISVFVGAGLVFAGVTDFCGMAIVLARMPWNQS